MKVSRLAAISAIFSLLIQQSALAATVAYSETGQPVSAGTQISQAERREARRQHFTHARKLLLDKSVPFEPEDLLDDEWPTKLKHVLDGMPEMQQVCRETAPLKGAYIADTLYLPEKVELGDHTVILVKNLVFEGRAPVIKGPFDIHFFPTQPTAVLGTTLADFLHKKAGYLNVGFAGGLPELPRFALISDAVQKGKHTIVFDTSGGNPASVKKSTPTSGNLKTASWSGPVPAAFQDPGCATGCDKSGAQPPPPASQGLPGDTGAAGNSPGKAPNGTCVDPANGSNDGMEGGFADVGAIGGTGGFGVPGSPGRPAGNIDAQVADNDFNNYNFIANGGDGQDGGAGGIGGLGGTGGTGGDGGDGVACSCSLGHGGQAGQGNSGGPGGTGGTGGDAGDGGLAGTISVSLPAGSPGATTSNKGGVGGTGGVGNVGRTGGLAGQAGHPGAGAIACNAEAPPGDTNLAGHPGATGDPGKNGSNGTSQPPGPAPNITYRSAGGGGGFVNCIGGDGPGPSDFSNSNGVVAPLCSPIIIDTEGEGFQLTSADNGVMFDIRGDGHPVKLAWTARGSHNAFLALDRNGDGTINSGKELFGNFTQQPAAAHPNGFLALAEFDKPENGGNGDGVIDEHDAVYPRLRLWIDENHDGISQPTELHTLAELGVLSLSLDYFQAEREDRFGNRFRYKAKVNPNRHDKRDEASEVGRWAYDVFLIAAPK
jgi:hypothetical protein